MKKVVTLVVFLLLQASPAFCANRTIMVFKLRGIGVHDELLTAGSYLLRQDLSRSGRFDIIAANDFTGADTCYDASCAIPLAAAQGANQAVTGTMLRIGKKIIVECTVFDVTTGKPLLYNSLSADTPADLDAVIDRLSDAIVQDKSVSQVITLNNITEQETRSPRRVQSSAYMGLDMGITTPLASSYLDSGSLSNFDGLIFSYEPNEHTMLQFKPALGFSWSNPGDTDVIDWKILEIGGYYVTNDQDIAPFVGGSVSLHLLNMSRTINSGTAYASNENYTRTATGVFAGGGVMFFRTTSTRLYVEAGYQAILDSFDGHGANGIVFDFGFLFRI